MSVSLESQITQLETIYREDYLKEKDYLKYCLKELKRDVENIPVEAMRTERSFREEFNGKVDRALSNARAVFRSICTNTEIDEEWKAAWEERIDRGFKKVSIAKPPAAPKPTREMKPLRV